MNELGIYTTLDKSAVIQNPCRVVLRTDKRSYGDHHLSSHLQKKWVGLMVSSNNYIDIMISESCIIIICAMVTKQIIDTLKYVAMC